MRVSHADLRIARRGGLTIRFATMGPVIYLIGELSDGGSSGTLLETPCTSPHWALLLRGEIEVERDGLGPVRVDAGQAFHVPAGDPPHRFRAAGRLAALGFAPLEPTGIDEGDIDRAGFEIIDELGETSVDPETSRINIASVAGPVALKRGQIEAEASIMGPWVFSLARFGSVSGYAASWCDLPHWGTVIHGTIAIEWEDDVEIIGAGEAFYCPAGPPGHRIEVTDSATVADYTPLDAIIRPGRTADWRPRLAIAVSEGPAAVEAPAPVVVVGLDR